MLGPGLSLPATAAIINGAPIDVDARAFFAALSSSPSRRIQNAVNTLIKGLKAAGIWAIADDIRVAVPGHADGFLLDLRGKRPKGTLSPTAPAYDDATGAYTGNGSSAYIGLGYDLTTASPALNFSQNGGSISVWPLAGTGYAVSNNGTRISLATVTTSGSAKFANLSWRINEATTYNLGGTYALAPYDLITINRASATESTVSVGGRLVATQADASAALTGGPAQVLGNSWTALYGATTLGAYVMAGALSRAQQIRLRWAIARYFLAVGVVTSTATSVPTESPWFWLGGTPFQAQNAGQSWSMVCDGPKFIFDVHAGDIWPGDVSAGHNDRNRSQIFSTGRFGLTEPVWVAYSARLLAECDQLSYPQWSLIQQWHADDSVQQLPPWALSLSTNDPSQVDERLRVATIYDTTSANPPAWNGAYYDLLGVSPIQRGRVFNIVQCIKRGIANDAQSLVWINGVQVQNLTGINLGYGAEPAAGWYPVVGPYRALGTQRTVVEISNLEISKSDLSDRILNPLPLAA